MTRRVRRYRTGICHACPYDATDNRPSSASDRLRLEYDGNRLTSVTDSVTTGHSYANATGFTDLFSPQHSSNKFGSAFGLSKTFHFADGASQSVEYEYDDNGNMTKDFNFSIKREKRMLAYFSEREKNRLKVNFSIKREKRMLACFSEREKNRLKVNRGYRA